jgi:purine-binding chemotaxis protein CheW
MAKDKHQLLTFTLGSEVYAMEVTTTREVLEFTGLTPIPRVPSWIRGVLNLRGTVIPVLDLKQKLGMGRTEQSRDSCVLILELSLDGEQTIVGILADSVREVFEIEQAQIGPPPRFGSQISTEYLRGVGHRNDTLFILLDVQKIFAIHELTLAEATAQATEAAAIEFATTATTATAAKANSPNDLSHH